jgi:hypothetical protein
VPATPPNRGVIVRATYGRAAEVFRLYSGMAAAMEQICAEYADDDLELFAGFLRRTAEAGRAAAEELADS